MTINSIENELEIKATKLNAAMSKAKLAADAAKHIKELESIDLDEDVKAAIKSEMLAAIK